ncbi:glycosyltransferase family 2 protein [Pedosphaera parvula]|uniref:Glycosyl transferase family 2 n=1 Tax=Pedosphaera parvula (strain Ellin514) TaxID=320771 RepID=B9XIP1_PEDPL|nr:glycosyltransferase family 2 protein [Pedosphaera parvula]EEF60304.1 glycosyl transferase family 2 [Pedosphaera parvula Ellin514]
METTNSIESKQPRISVVILNYNGAKWLQRCLASLQKQTIFSQIEVIVADNLSSDGSDALAEKLLKDWPNGHFLQNGSNLGFCEGNNRGAKLATGKYIFFLNNDTWLEPDCLEILLCETEKHQAGASMPLVLDYEDNTFQALGAAGFDIFGLPSARFYHADTREVLMAEGCSYLIERNLFYGVGQFDSEFFMFADEYDLSWRVWIAGRSVLAVTPARLHHRGMAHVNPQGGGEVVEFRTSDTKRFYATRNNLILLLKNAHNLLLLLVPLQVMLLTLEAMVLLLLTRRWSFVRRSFFSALADCWRLRDYIAARRREINGFRKRSDFQMLRFLSWRWNRFYELQRLRRYGLPKVTAR